MLSGVGVSFPRRPRLWNIARAEPNARRRGRVVLVNGPHGCRLRASLGPPQSRGTRTSARVSRTAPFDPTADRPRIPLRPARRVSCLRPRCTPSVISGRKMLASRTATSSPPPLRIRTQLVVVGSRPRTAGGRLFASLYVVLRPVAGPSMVARIGFSATTSRESRQGRKAAAAATMSGAGARAGASRLH
jgi:hypothetical protein